jgi:hypothetical protein
MMKTVTPKVKVDAYECTRCGHVWVPRKDTTLPVTCPNRKCNSPYWDKPRKTKK